MKERPLYNIITGRPRPMGEKPIDLIHFSGECTFEKKRWPKWCLLFRCYLEKRLLDANCFFSPDLLLVCTPGRLKSNPTKSAIKSRASSFLSFWVRDSLDVRYIELARVFSLLPLFSTSPSRLDTISWGKSERKPFYEPVTWHNFREGFSPLSPFADHRSGWGRCR